MWLLLVALLAVALEYCWENYQLLHLLPIYNVESCHRFVRWRVYRVLVRPSTLAWVVTRGARVESGTLLVGRELLGVFVV